MASDINALAYLLQGKQPQELTETPQGPGSALLPMFGQQAPQTPQATPSPYDQTRQQIADYMKQVSELAKPGANENKLSALLANTPEKRAKDIYNSSLGTTIDPDTGKEKHNWLKYIATTLGQGGQAWFHPGKYQPLMDKARATGLKEYEAESAPLLREMGLEAQMKRASLSDIQKALGNMVGLDWHQGVAANQSRANDIKQQLADLKAKLTPAQFDLIQARVSQAQSEKEALDALAQVRGAQTEKINLDTAIKQQTGGLTGEAANAQLMNNKPVNEYQRLLDTMGKMEEEKKKSKYPPVATQVIDTPFGKQVFDKRNPSAPAKPVNFMGVYQNDPEVTNAYAGTPAKPIFTDQAGAPDHSRIPGIAAVPEQYRSLVNSAPVRKELTGEALRRVNASELGYQNAKDLTQMLNKMTPDQIGTLAGNWQKYITQNTSTADPNIAKFIETAKILGANHSSAQAFRSTQFVDEIGNALSKLGTNKKAIQAGINAYGRTFEDTLNKYPETKRDQFAKGLSAIELLRIYHRDIYDKLLRNAQGK